MFVFKTKDFILIALVYVDDIIVTVSSTFLLSRIISFLGTNFSLKDRGTLHYFLAIEANITKDSLLPTHTMFIKDLLQRVPMTESKHISYSKSCQISFSSWWFSLLRPSSLQKYNRSSPIHPSHMTRNSILRQQSMPIHASTNWSSLARLWRESWDIFPGTMYHGVCLSSDSNFNMIA